MKKKCKNKKKRLGQKLLLQDARLSKTRSWLLGECRKCFKSLGSFLLFDSFYHDSLIYMHFSNCIGKRQRMPLNWKPIVLVGLLPVLDLTCKAPESIGAFVHLLMRKLSPSFLSLSTPFAKTIILSSRFTAVVLISPTNVYPILRRPVQPYSRFQA